jgi:hypothetical protein
LNPDGYIHSFEKDRLWRKNRSPNGKYRGVDLNRNFDIFWNKAGSSSNPLDCNYAGPSAFSELESTAMKNFLENSTRIRAYFSLHSFSQLFMFPFGFTSEKIPNYEDLKLFGDKAVKGVEKMSGKKYDKFDFKYKNFRRFQP